MAMFTNKEFSLLAAMIDEAADNAIRRYIEGGRTGVLEASADEETEAYWIAEGHFVYDTDLAA